MLQTFQRVKGPLPLNLLDSLFISSTTIPRRRVCHVRYWPSLPAIKTEVVNIRKLFTTRSTWRDNPAHTNSTESYDSFTSLKDDLFNHQINSPPHVEFDPDKHLLSALRLALGVKVVDDVCDIFQSLSERSELASITGRDWEIIARFLYAHIKSLSPSDDLRPGIERMAILAATEGHILGLKALMILNLRKCRVDDVAALFDRYFSLCEKSKLKAEVPDLLEDLENISDSVLISEATDLKSILSGVGDLFLVVIAAYCTQNLWEKALDRLLSMPTAVRLTRDKVKSFCNRYIKDDAVLAAKIKLWAEELVVSRLVSRSASLHSYLSTLANDNQLRAIMNLYKRIIDECRKADGRLSVKQSANGQGVTIVSPNTWTYFIKAFFKCSRVDLIDRLWNDVTELNLIPHPEMWFAVLDGYARHHGGQFLKAQATWNRMLDAGIEPDEFAYGSMIHAYFYARRLSEAVSLFEQFKSFLKRTPQGKASLHDRSMLPLYNIVINGLCINQQEDKARALMKELMDFGPQPDIVTYNIFLRYYARVGDMQRLMGVLRSLKPAGVEADNYSFTTVLSALYKAGQKDAHITILQTMADTRIQPNVAMYSTIINFLVRQGGKENSQKAISLLTKMESEPDKTCRPNEVTYTGLLAGIHRDPTLSETEIKMYSDDLLHRMQKTGVSPNRATFHYLIKASLENPGAHGLQLALKYYGQMQKKGISLNDRTWFILLSGLVRRNERAVAKEVMREMFHSGHQPDEYLSNLVRQLQR